MILACQAVPASGLLLSGVPVPLCLGPAAWLGKIMILAPVPVAGEYHMMIHSGAGARASLSSGYRD